MYPDEIEKNFSNGRIFEDKPRKNLRERFSGVQGKVKINNKSLIGGIFVLGLAVTSVFLSTRILNPVGDATRSKAAADVQVLNQLEEKVQTKGKVRVIVQLANEIKPEGTLTGPQKAAQSLGLQTAQKSVASAIAGSGAKVIHSYSSIPYMALEVDPQGLSKLKQMKGTVISISEDAILYPNLGESRAVVGAETYAGLIDGVGSTVAILDSGVETTHPFLQGAIIHEVCFGDCPNGEKSQDGPGSAIPCVWDITCYHGTAMAGVIAGRGGMGGTPPYKGIAPGASVVAIRTVTQECRDFDKDPATPDTCTFGSAVSEEVAALEWIYQNANVYQIGAVNMSMGLPSSDRYCDQTPQFAPVFEAIKKLREINIATVISAGNHGETAKIDFPGCLSNAIVAGAITKAQQITSISNVAPFHQNLFLAVGEAVTTSVQNGKMESLQGTSIAAPMVAAAYAILKPMNPGVTVDSATALLKETAKYIQDSRPGATNTQYPLIQLDKAIAKVLGLGPTASCSASSGTSTSCNMGSAVLGDSIEAKDVLGTSIENPKGEVLQATTTSTGYGNLLLISAAYRAHNVPTAIIQRMTYCGYPLSRLGGSTGRASFTDQHVEMWYMFNPPTPPVGYCSFQAFFITSATNTTPADPEERVFTRAILTNVPDSNFIAGTVRTAGYNYPSGSTFFDLTDLGPKDSKFICTYSNNPNGGANTVTPTNTNWFQAPGSYQKHNRIQSAMGVSNVRTADNQTKNIKWNATQSQAWAGVCINVRIKSSGTTTATPPPSTPAPLPGVNLKINNSDGPVTTDGFTAITISWSSSHITSCTASGGWSGTKAANGTESKLVNRTNKFSIFCTGPNNAQVSDAVQLNIAYDKGVCWDKAVASGVDYTWKDMCRGVFTSYTKDPATNKYYCALRIYIAPRPLPTGVSAPTSTVAPYSYILDSREATQRYAWSDQGKPKTPCYGLSFL